MLRLFWHVIEVIRDRDIHGFRAEHTCNKQRFPSLPFPSLPFPLPSLFLSSFVLLGNIREIPTDKVKLLLSEARKVFSNEPSLLQLNTPAEGNMTVCGDVHGQFVDVEHIFELGGVPSSDNVFIFNGDLVDRGSQSLEIVLTLFAHKLLDNKSVYVLRGNHETVSINSRYGFKGEVLEMFGVDVYEDIASVFNQLPYAAVLHEDTLVVHGGPVGCNDYVNLEAIECIKRGNPS